MRIMTCVSAAIICGMFAVSAQAQERPACPTGVEAGWHWAFDEDHVWLTSPDTVVTWELADESSTTTQGVTFSLYWSSWYDFYEGKQMKDGDKKLQMGFFVPPPNLEIGYVDAFAQGEPETQHDYFVQLKSDGEVISTFEQNFEKGWKSTNSKNLFVSASDNLLAPALLSDLKTEPTDLTVEVRVKDEYAPKSRDPDAFGSGSFTLPSIGTLADELKPKVEAEMQRAQASRVYCIEPDY